MHYYCSHDAASQLNVVKRLTLVMGGIENFLSRLLKDKIPQYHGIDFYILINILLRFMSSCNYCASVKYFLSNKLSYVSRLLVIVLIVKLLLSQYTSYFSYFKT